MVNMRTWSGGGEDTTGGGGEKSFMLKEFMEQLLQRFEFPCLYEPTLLQIPVAAEVKALELVVCLRLGVAELQVSSPVSKGLGLVCFFVVS